MPVGAAQARNGEAPNRPPAPSQQGAPQGPPAPQKPKPTPYGGDDDLDIPDFLK